MRYQGQLRHICIAGKRWLRDKAQRGTNIEGHRGLTSVTSMSTEMAVRKGACVPSRMAAHSSGSPVSKEIIGGFDRQW